MSNLNDLVIYLRERKLKIDCQNNMHQLTQCPSFFVTAVLLEVSFKFPWFLLNLSSRHCSYQKHGKCTLYLHYSNPSLVYFLRLFKINVPMPILINHWEDFWYFCNYVSLPRSFRMALYSIWYIFTSSLESKFSSTFFISFLFGMNVGNKPEFCLSWEENNQRWFLNLLFKIS